MALTKIPANLLDTSAHVDLLDNEQIRLGSSQDFQLYHTGSGNSIISETGSGSLYLDGTNIYLRKSTSSGEALADFVGDGAVTLYHNGNPKLATSSSGITVTGSISGATATASGGTNTTALASTAFVQQEITSLIGGAPGTLDTLNELAAAINDDSNYNSTLTTALATKLPLAGGTLTGGLVVTAGNGDQLALNNAGERFTQIGLQHSGTQNGALWLDDTDGMVDLYANTSHGIRLKTGGDNPRVTILSGGNVGIGTSAPSGILSIPSTDTTTKPQIRFMTTGATNLADAALSTTDDSGGTNLLIGSNQYYSGASIARFDTSRSGTAIDFGYTGRMKFFTGSGNAAPTERMQITSAGNVNIGYGVTNTQTTWPLHLSYSNNSGAHGGIQVKNTNAGTTSNFAGMSAHAVNGGVKAFYYAADYDAWGVGAFAGSASNHDFYLMSNNTKRMVIDASGNVVIGNSTYGSSLGQLRVINDAASAPASLSLFGYNNISDDAEFAKIDFASQISGTGGNPTAKIAANIEGVNERAAHLTFHTHNDGGSLQERMRIHSNGNVGIGTNDPYGKLQIEGNTNGWNVAPMIVFSSSATGQAAVRDWAIGPADTSYGYFHINQGASTGASPLATSNVRFTISDTGRVGIGETVPDYMLHVKNTNTQIAIESTTTNQNSSLYYIANGANQWETGVNITAGLDYEIYDRVNNGARMVVQHDGKIRIGNNVPMWSGSYGGGLFLKGNNATSDRYARLAIVDSTGAETASGSLTLNNNGSVEITRSINGSGSASYENILTISRTGGATSNASREAAVSFFDSANSTYTAMITGVRESPAGNYNGGLSIYTNSHADNGNATSISEMVSGKVVHFAYDQSTTFYGDVYVAGANHRISQNGVTREAKGGYVNGNATVSYTVNHTNQSSFKVQAAMSHYGIMTSYGCAHEGIYGNGSGGLYSVLTQSHTSGASGSWSVTRVDTDNITVTKAAGTYSGGGYYYIIVEGANL